jgi:hypothetical protein
MICRLCLTRDVIENSTAIFRDDTPIFRGFMRDYVKPGYVERIICVLQFGF